MPSNESSNVTGSEVKGSEIKGFLAAIWIALNTLLLGTPLLAVAALRAIAAPRGPRLALERFMDRFVDAWVWNNAIMLGLLGVTRIDAHWEHDTPLERDGWYLVISNHLGWSDILILQELLRGRIPPLKFFVKRPLLWFPIVGAAMWLLNFPFLRRYSAEKLARNPALKGVDREATLAACRQLERHPSSLVSFVEGTRCTPEKRLAQASPYRHLLKPKLGGIGYSLQGLGHRFHRVIDVTLMYPEGVPTFWGFLCGRAPRVVAEVRTHAIPATLLEAADALDSGNRDALAQWIGELWQAKDDRIGERLACGLDPRPGQLARN